MARLRLFRRRMATRPWPQNVVAASQAAVDPPVTDAVRPAPQSIGVLLAVIFAMVYALTSAGAVTSKDGGIMYDTAAAILKTGSLALPPHHHGIPGVNGHFYSKYGIAQSLVEVPFYALGELLSAPSAPPASAGPAAQARYTRLEQDVTSACVALTNVVIGALTMWLVYLLAYEMRPRVGRAAGVAILVGVATPLWPYAKTDFSEPLLTLGLTGAVLFLMRARSRPSAAHFADAGVFAAIAVLTKPIALFALPALGLYALFAAVRAADRATALRRLSRVIAWLVPVAVGLVLLALYNVVRFGGPLRTGYANSDDLPFHAPLLTGLEGLFVSTGKGFLWYCPLAIPVLLMWWYTLRTRTAEGLLGLAIIVPSVVALATYPVWWGGYCWGPRYLVPLVPLILLPLPYLLDALPQYGYLRGLTVLTGTLSVVVQVLGVAVQSSRFIVTGLSDAQYLWIPHDSPILGHAWLAAFDVVRVFSPKDIPRMLAAYPWRHPTGTSLSQVLAIQNWSYWWWVVLGRYLSSVVEIAIAAVAGVILLIAIGLLRHRVGVAALQARYDSRRMAVPQMHP